MPTGSSPRRSSQMATGKRASMREGPLADLFRRTTEDNPPRQEQREPEPPAAPAPEPTSPASESIQTTPERATPEHRRRAHPSLESDARSPMIDEPEREIPSPQERLRQAFSAD